MKKRNYLKRAGIKKTKAGGGKRMKWYSPFRWLVFSFFVTLNIFFAFMLIASAYSGFVSPVKNVLFAYAGLLFPILILVNSCFLIYWIIVKRWGISFILVMVFALCWRSIAIFCPFHFNVHPPPREEMIKILSYNVMSFAYQNHTKEKPNKIIEYIAESDADIVCLQEYMVSSRRNLMSSQAVERALSMYPYKAEIFFSNAENKNNQYGLALFSKFPILSSRKIPFTSRYNGSAIYEIYVDGKKVTVVNNHLESFKLTAEDRSKYSDMISNINFDSFEHFSGDMQRKLGQAFRIRSKQSEIIAAEIKKANSYYTIVCGDFNDTPLSYAHRTIQDSLIDAYAESGKGLGISYNQNYFYFRIDHIFHSISMDAYNCRVDAGIKLSDHYPIYCYLKLK